MTAWSLAQRVPSMLTDHCPIRRLAGFASHGMVLCAKGSDGPKELVKFVQPPSEARAGDRVVLEGFASDKYPPATAAQVKRKKVSLDAQNIRRSYTCSAYDQKRDFILL